MSTVRKRNRKSLSCYNCKKRKVRCDKNQPCSTCVKHGDDCQYQLFSKVPVAPPVDASVHEELNMLKQKLSLLENNIHKRLEPERAGLGVFGANPLTAIDYRINFFELSFQVPNQECGWKTSGPLNWKNIMHLDGVLSKLVVFLTQYKKLNRKAFYTDQAPECEADPCVSNGFVRKVRDMGDGDEMKPLKDFKKNATELRNARVARSKINERAKALGLMFYEGEIDEELALIDKVELVLPKRRAIWKLVDRYFTRLYPMFPFLDESDFRQNLARFIGPESDADEKVTNLRVDKKLDFAHLGTLLVVLRLSYLTLFTNNTTANHAHMYGNDPLPHAQEIRYLFNNVVSIDAVDMAELCLKSFNVISNAYFPVLQLFFYLLLYRVNSPEDGETQDNLLSQGMTGKVVQMAYALGVNREPSTFVGSPTDPRTQNLYRKIWAHLRMLDFNLAFANGTPLLINSKYFDVKPPYFEPGNANVKDVALEIEAIAYTELFESYTPLMEKILDLIIDMRGSSSVNEVNLLLNELELSVLLRYRNGISKANSLDNNFAYIKKLRTYFTVNLFLVSVYMHLFNFFERRNHTDYIFFYLKKLVVLTVSEVFPIYHDLLVLRTDLFNKSTDFTVTPQLASMLLCLFLVTISLITRARLGINVLENLPINTATEKEFLEGIRNVLASSEKALDQIMKYFGCISDRNYFAWRAKKAGSFLLLVGSSKEFLQHSGMERCSFEMPVHLLNDVCDVLGRAVNDPNIQQTRSYPTPGVSDDWRFPEQPPELLTTDLTSSGEIDSLWLQMMTVKQTDQEDLNSPWFPNGLVKPALNTEVLPELQMDAPPNYDFLDLFSSGYTMQ